MNTIVGCIEPLLQWAWCEPTHCSTVYYTKFEAGHDVMLKRNLCVLMTFLEAKATVSAQHHSWLTYMVFDKDEASG